MQMHICRAYPSRGLIYEAEANFWRLRQRPRPKIITKKYQIMINNIRFKIIAGKIKKIPEFYTIFARKIRDYNNNNEIEARPRPKFSPGGPFDLEDLASLL